MTVYDDALRSIQEGIAAADMNEVKGSLRQRKKTDRLAQGEQDREATKAKRDGTGDLEELEPENNPPADPPQDDSPKDDKPEIGLGNKRGEQPEPKSVDSEPEPEPKKETPKDSMDLAAEEAAKKKDAEREEEEAPTPTPDDWSKSVDNDGETREDDEDPNFTMPERDGTGPESNDSDGDADFSDTQESPSGLFQAVQDSNAPAFAKAIRAGVKDGDLDDLSVAIEDEGLTAIQNLVYMVAKAVKKGGRATT